MILYRTNQSVKLPAFEFDSPLTNLVIELDHLRNTKLSGTAPFPLFFDLKRLFLILESVQSARIEGNRTTVAEMFDPLKNHTLLISTLEQEYDFNVTELKFMPAGEDGSLYTLTSHEKNTSPNSLEYVVGKKRTYSVRLYRQFTTLAKNPTLILW